MTSRHTYWADRQLKKGLCRECTQPRYRYVISTGEVKHSIHCREHFDKARLRSARHGNGRRGPYRAKEAA